jgi:hypothetical protein
MKLYNVWKKLYLTSHRPSRIKIGLAAPLAGQFKAIFHRSGIKLIPIYTCYSMQGIIK